MRWARFCELSLGGWLILSPIPVERAGWFEAGMGLCIAILVLICLADPDSRAHLWELAVAGVLVTAGWLEARLDATAATQSLIVSGLLIAMFAIVPTRSFDPPPAWRREDRT